MAEALANSTVEPTTTLTATATPASDSTFTVTDGSGMPSSGTFRVAFSGTTTAIIAVTRSSNTLTKVSVEQSGDASYPSGSSVNLVWSAAGMDARYARLDTANTYSTVNNGPNGSASATSWSARAAGNGVYSSAANTLDLASNGTQAVSISGSTMTVQSTRLLQTNGGLTVNNRFALGIRFFAQGDASIDGDPILAADINSSTTTVTVDDSTLFENDTVPFSFIIGTEWFVCTAVVGNTLTVATRGRLGSTAASHTAGDILYDYATDYLNSVISPTSSPLTVFGSPLTGDTTIYLPPKSNVGTWLKPAANYELEISFADMASHTVTIKEDSVGDTIATLTGSGASPSPGGFLAQYSTTNTRYFPKAKFEG